MKSNVYIIGFAKCGTTSIDSWLNQINNITCARPKEPHWYSTDLNHGKLNSEYDYNNCFKDEGDIRIDTSVWYIYSNDALKNILKKDSNSKFIILYRPIEDFLKSVHSQMLFTGYENIKDINKAWKLSKKRQTNKKLVPFTCIEPKLLDYKGLCDWNSQIKKTISLVSKENLLFCSLNIIKENKKLALKQICKFINVDLNSEKINFTIENKRKERKYHFLVKLEHLTRRVYDFLKIKGLGSGFFKLLDRFNIKTKRKKEIMLNEEILEEILVRQKEFNNLTNKLINDRWNFIC